MGQNKEHLNKLLDFIDQLAKDRDNAWFVKRLRERYGLRSDGKIDDIYEYCIEQVVRDQAHQFYKDFPIKELIPGLREDFEKMELYRRRNSFEDFSLAVYQQIERITNWVCQDKKLNDAVLKLMGHPAYIRSFQKSDGTWGDATISDRTGTYQIAKLIFIKDASEKSKSYLSAQFALDRLSCILYFVCYQAKLKSQEYEQFVNYKNTYSAIYTFRCLNHRGSELKDYQKTMIEDIRLRQGVYYFKFMQALLFYVEGVANGLPKLEELYCYAATQNAIEVKPDGPKVLGTIDLPEDNKKRFK